MAASTSKSGHNASGVTCAANEAFSRYAAATLARAKGRLIRCTVTRPTPNRSAILRIPSVRLGLSERSRHPYGSWRALAGDDGEQHSRASVTMPVTRAYRGGRGHGVIKAAH